MSNEILPLHLAPKFVFVLTFNSASLEIKIQKSTDRYYTKGFAKKSQLKPGIVHWNDDMKLCESKKVAEAFRQELIDCWIKRTEETIKEQEERLVKLKAMNV